VDFYDAAGALEYVEQEIGRSLPTPQLVRRHTGDTSLVRGIVEAVLPDPDVRNFVLNCFVDSAALANEGAPRAWCVNRHENKHISLKVWSYYHFSIGPWQGGRISHICLSIDGNVLSDEDRQLADELTHATWKVPPGAMYVDIPSDRAVELFPRFLPAHRALIERNRSRRSPHYQVVPSDVDAYFIEEIGRGFPEPKLPNPVEQLPLSVEAERVRQDIELIIPDADVRTTLLEYIADGIEAAHAVNPGAWVVASYRSGSARSISLFTGWIMTINLNAKGWSMRVERSEISPEMTEALAPYATREGQDKRLDESIETYRFPHAVALSRVPDLKDAWLATARNSLESNRLSRFRRDHSPATLEYLAWATGRDLPQPAYAESTVARGAWKISTSDKGLAASASLLEGVVGLSFLPGRDATSMPSDSFDEFLKAIPSTDRAPNHGPAQTWSFARDVAVGDRMFLYEGGSIVALGEVIGEYQFVPGHNYPHQRLVDWFEYAPLHISKVSPDLAPVMLKSFSTLDRLDADQADTFERLLSRAETYEPEAAFWDGDWRDVYARVFQAEGLQYTAWQRAVFFTALQTKGFVILSGISGTGKTKIAQAFAEALPAPPDGRAVEFLTVRPDWRDSKSLLGYHNPITEKYEWTAFLRFLMRAKASWEARDGLAWFVILDEMNLAHVEHYFADLLSIIESGRDADGWSRQPIRLGERFDEDGPPAELRLPPNLAVIGTVNLDETTHAFSPKVLDRAFAIELSDVSFDLYLPGISSTSAMLTESERWALLNAFSSDGEYPRINREAAGKLVKDQSHLRDWMQALNTSLRPYHMHFGYRVFDEVMAFVDHGQRNGLFAAIAGEDEEIAAAFDAAVLMKVLPKFHGSRQRLEGPLASVIAWCQNPANPVPSDVVEMIRSADSPGAMETQLMSARYRFPQTAHRAIRMLWTAYVEGFAAFG